MQKIWQIISEEGTKMQAGLVLQLNSALCSPPLQLGVETFLKVIAKFLLIFGPNVIRFFDWCKTANILQEKYLFGGLHSALGEPEAVKK